MNKLFLITTLTAFTAISAAHAKDYHCPDPSAITINHPTKGVFSATSKEGLAFQGIFPTHVMVNDKVQELDPTKFKIGNLTFVRLYPGQPVPLTNQPGSFQLVDHYIDCHYDITHPDVPHSLSAHMQPKGQTFGTKYGECKGPTKPTIQNAVVASYKCPGCEPISCN